jgi:hypothetical protein
MLPSCSAHLVHDACRELIQRYAVSLKQRERVLLRLALHSKLVEQVWNALQGGNDQAMLNDMHVSKQRVSSVKDAINLSSSWFVTSAFQCSLSLHGDL